MDILQAEAIADGFEDGYESPTTAAAAISSDEDDLTHEQSFTDPSSLSSDDADTIGDNENLRFLKLSFPKQSLTTLTFVLAKSHEDVLKAVDELLNHELLDEEKQLNGIVDGAEAGAVDDFFAHAGTTQHHKRKRKSQKKQRGILQKNELDPTLASSSKPMTSRWDQIGSEVDWMVRVLSLPKPTVQSAYHQHNSSLPNTLNALLEDNRWEDCKANPDHDDNYTRLIRSYPGLGSIKITDILNATKDQLPLSIEIANVLAAWRPTIGTITSSLQKTSLSSPSKSTSHAQVDHSSSLFSIDDNMTADQCRAMAAEFAGKRDAAFRQAATAYQRSKSDGLMGGTAMYYSELGRDFDLKMRTYKLKAAQLSAVQRSGNASDLDLHGVSVHEGLVIVKEGVTNWYAKSKMLETGDMASPLRIVTGLGRHSVGGEAKLLPAVRKYLDRDGWRYEASGGVILVVGLLKK